MNFDVLVNLFVCCFTTYLGFHATFLTNLFVYMDSDLDKVTSSSFRTSTLYARSRHDTMVCKFRIVKHFDLLVLINKELSFSMQSCFCNHAFMILTCKEFCSGRNLYCNENYLRLPEMLGGSHSPIVLCSKQPDVLMQFCHCIPSRMMLNHNTELKTSRIIHKIRLISCNAHVIVFIVKSCTEWNEGNAYKRSAQDFGGIVKRS